MLPSSAALHGTVHLASYSVQLGNRRWIAWMVDLESKSRCAPQRLAALRDLVSLARLGKREN